MKTFIFILLALASTNSFCQKQSFWYNSAVRHYNYLNNQSFAELELEDTSGKLVSTSSLLGKTVYVDFWFTTCGPCIKEIPMSQSLQQCFANDTNIVFVNICIENVDRKNTWRKMIKEKQMTGLHLFYARNRPQKINLLREYNITFPTYLLLNTKMKIAGYDAPRPSEVGWVNWAITSVAEGKSLATAFSDFFHKSEVYRKYTKSIRTCLASEKSFDKHFEK